MRSLGGQNSLARRRISWIVAESNLLEMARGNFPTPALDDSSDRILLLEINGIPMWCRIQRGEIPLNIARYTTNNMPVVEILKKFKPAGMKRYYWCKYKTRRRLRKDLSLCTDKYGQLPGIPLSPINYIR